MVRKTNVVFASREVALGEAEWAATQTVHLAESVALVWWCAVKATADHRVNRMLNQPTRLQNSCMKLPYLVTLNLQRKKMRHNSNSVSMFSPRFKGSRSAPPSEREIQLRRKCREERSKGPSGQIQDAMGHGRVIRMLPRKERKVKRTALLLPEFRKEFFEPTAGMWAEP